MPPVNKNQKLANAAFKTAHESQQFTTANQTLNAALTLAKAGHARAGLKGPGPTNMHVLGAAGKYFKFY
jgi:hypothetical protein